MSSSNLSAARVRALMDYDPSTGAFTWRTRPETDFKTPQAWKSWNTRKSGQPVGCLCPKGYAVCGIAGRHYQMHRLAWLHHYGEEPEVIDHINGNPSDNRIANLRSGSYQLNNQNRRAAPVNKKHAAPLGARKSARFGKPWAAAIRVNGKNVWLGGFNTAEEAHAAYVEAKRRLHPGCTL